MSAMVQCPICGATVRELRINAHLDSGCTAHTESATPSQSQSQSEDQQSNQASVPAFFRTGATKQATKQSPATKTPAGKQATFPKQIPASPPSVTGKRAADAEKERDISTQTPTRPSGSQPRSAASNPGRAPSAKRQRTGPSGAAPLADRMRPRTLDEIYGQPALVGPTGLLRSLLAHKQAVPSMILWGGPGTGKTTIARALAGAAGGMRFVELSGAGAAAGLADTCKRVFSEARNELALTGRRTLVFADEIHRFNKGQQDVFLAPVEAGTVTLVGATTENPSFRVQNALLSRCRVFTLGALREEDVVEILRRALDRVREEDGPGEGQDEDEDGVETEDRNGRDPGVNHRENSSSSASTSSNPIIPPAVTDPILLSTLARASDGDARAALNLLELALSLARQQPTQPASALTSTLLAAAPRALAYDRAGDGHYDTISALHKSIRGSDPHATLYYLARMIAAGEDPAFLMRRLLVVASEDVGLADRHALPLVAAAAEAVDRIGMPEARISIAHAAVYLALAPKSTRVYRGINAALAAVEREPGVGSAPVPLHLRNAPARLMAELGYARGYKYNPNFVDGRVVQEYLPEDLKGRQFLSDRDLGTVVDPDLAEEKGDEVR